MGATSGSLPHGESELEATGLSAAPSTAITVPRIEEAPVAFEGHEWPPLEIRSNRMVVGTVPHAHFRDGLLDPETLQLEHNLLQPVGRMAAPNC